MQFAGLKYLNLFPNDENYTCEILDATMIIKEDRIYWCDCGGLSEKDIESYTGTTIWATQRDSSDVDIQGITYVYLYYTKDGSESYYADYDEADNVNTSLYANMSVSVAKWSTDGSSGFHSTHKTQGIENNRITATDTKNVSKANFGK